MTMILTGDATIARLRTQLYYLLTEIMDHDLAHIEGGAARLDHVAWEIARQCAEDDPGFPAHLGMYLKEES
jgi:hypothetical protein